MEPTLQDVAKVEYKGQVELVHGFRSRPVRVVDGRITVCEVKVITTEFPGGKWLMIAGPKPVVRGVEFHQPVGI